MMRLRKVSDLPPNDLPPQVFYSHLHLRHLLPFVAPNASYLLPSPCPLPYFSPGAPDAFNTVESPSAMSPGDPLSHLPRSYHISISPPTHI